MRRNNLIAYALVLAVCALFIASSGWTAGETGKMTVTTTSQKAMDYYLKGQDLNDRLRLTEARTQFEKAVTEDPNFALGYLNLAFTQPTAKGYFENFNKARALADKVTEGERLWILGVEAGNNADVMRQRELYKKLVSILPNDERVHNIMGTHYFAQQEWDMAIKEYTKATEINPNFSQPYNQLGYAQRFTGNYTEAEKAFKKYIDLIPDDPNPYDSYAELLMKMGKYDESINYYRKALTINSTFAASRIGIATDLNFLGKHAEARKELQTLYNNAVDDGQRRGALFATAVSYVDEGNMDMALQEVNKLYAIAEKINDPTNMSNDLITMGNILLEDGKYDQATTKYNNALKVVETSTLSPEIKATAQRTHTYNTTRVALAKKDMTTAKARSDEYFKLVTAVNNPNEIRQAHELTGMIALQERDYMTARDRLEKANQQNPYNTYRLMLAYKSTGDKVKAKEMCERAANFNQLNSMNYAFIRHKAKEMLASM